VTRLAGDDRGRRRRLGRAAGGLLALVCLVGALFLWRPLTFIDARDRFFMWRHGIHAADLQAGGYRLHYLVAGEGRPLVLVHGLGGSSANWLRSIPDYARRGYRVYAPDLLGFGGSDAPDIDYAVSRQVAVLGRFLDGVRVRQADLAGISMGGWTSALFAIQHPDRVRRLVLLDSAGMTMRVDEARRIARSLMPETEGDLARMMAAITVRPAPIPGFVARDLLRRMREREWVVRRALDAMLTGREVLDGRLGTIRQPVLLVWGRDDLVTPLWIGEAMHREMRQSVLRILPGCGHVAAYACRNQVVPMVTEFLGGR
jgi:pimeloyl-ACP methyl ester carboxylesterase